MSRLEILDPKGEWKAKVSSSIKDVGKIPRVIIELAWMVVLKHCTVDEAVEALKTADTDASMHETIVDALWVAGIQVEAHNKKENNKESFDAFCLLVARLSTAEVIPKLLLRQRLELNVLESANISNEKIFRQREV
jgi:hypothetical protein